MNDSCPQQPVWGWTSSTDLHSETSAPYLLWSSPHPPSPPTSVSGLSWDTDCWQFSQEISKFQWSLSLRAYPLEHLGLSTAVRGAPHRPSLHSLGMQQHPQRVKGLLTLLLLQFLYLCFLIAARVSDSRA